MTPLERQTWFKSTNPAAPTALEFWQQPDLSPSFVTSGRVTESLSERLVLRGGFSLELIEDAEVHTETLRDSSIVTTEHKKFDPQQRLLEKTHLVQSTRNAKTTSFKKLWTFNAKGQATLESIDNKNDGEIEWWTRTDYAPDGRLLLLEKKSGTTSMRTEYQYDCQ